MTLTPRQKARATGNRYQDWVCKWLQERDWIIHNQKIATKMIKVRDKKTGLLKDIWTSTRQDLFGIFDICAKKQLDELYAWTLWIQSTTHKSVSEKVKKIIDAGLSYSEFERPMIWIKRDKTRHDIYAFDQVGQIVHPGEPSLYGKIINRKFFASENIKWEF